MYLNFNANVFWEKRMFLVLFFSIFNMLTIAVIAVAPTGKASFVYSYVQTRLKGQYNGK